MFPPLRKIKEKKEKEEKKLKKEISHKKVVELLFKVFRFCVVVFIVFSPLLCVVVAAGVQEEFQQAMPQVCARIHQ